MFFKEKSRESKQVMTIFPSMPFHNYKQNKVYNQQFDITSADTSSMKITYVLNTEISIGRYFHAGKRQPARTFYAEPCLLVRLAYQISWLLHICESN